MIRPLCIVTLTLGLAGCPGSDDGPTWTMDVNDEQGAILSFWGPSRTDLFAAGGTLETGGGQGRILWNDGDGWQPMTIDAPTLWWLHGFGHDNVWAVGELGTIAHFNGSDWVTLETGHDYTLWGIWGASPNEMWAVGGKVGGGVPSVLRKYDGNTWTDVPGVGIDDELLFKVWGTATDNVYVVGDGGAILHYDGSEWTRMDSGTAARLLTVRGRSATDIFAVGGVQQAVMLHYDGNNWSPVDVGEGPGLMGVWTAAGAPVVAAGFTGFTVLGDDDGWHPQPAMTYDCLHAVWGDGRGNYAVGGGNLVATGTRTGIIIVGE